MTATRKLHSPSTPSTTRPNSGDGWGGRSPAIRRVSNHLHQRPSRCGRCFHHEADPREGLHSDVVQSHDVGVRRKPVHGLDLVLDQLTARVVVECIGVGPEGLEGHALPVGLVPDQLQLDFQR